MPPLEDLLSRPFEEQLEVVEVDSQFWDEAIALAILSRAERSAEAAETLALVARSIGERVQSVPVVARSYCLSAELSAARGDMRTAERALERARHYLRSSPIEAPARAPLCRALGIFFREAQRTDEAVALLERAQVLFSGREQEWDRARCLIDLGLLFESGTSAERARELLRAGHRLLEQAGELSGVVAVRLYLAQALVSSSLEPEQAVRWLKCAAETSTSLGRADQFQVLLLEAKLLERSCRLDEALEVTERAAGLLVGNRCPRSVDAAATMLLDRARLLWRLGRRGESRHLAAELQHFPELPAHAREVIEFALDFVSAHEVNPSGLIKRAVGFLAESRSSATRFSPVERPRVTLFWEEIESDVRLSILRTCKMHPDLATTDLSEPTLSKLFWTYEALTGVRISNSDSAVEV